MNTRMCVVLALVFGLAMAAGIGTAQGDTFTWKNVTGNWNVSGNWVEGAVPDSADDLCTIAQGTMIIPSTATTFPATAYLNGTAGVGGTLQVFDSNSSRTISGALYLNGGKITHGTYGSYSVTVTGGVVAQTGTTTVIDVTTTVGGYTPTMTINGTLTGSGTINKTGPDSLAFGTGYTSGFGGIVNINGGYFSIGGTTTFGGTININSGGTLSDGDASKTWTITGGVNLNGGTLRSHGNNGATYSISSGDIDVVAGSVVYITGKTSDTNRPFIILNNKLTGDDALALYGNDRGLKLNNTSNTYSGTISVYENSNGATGYGNLIIGAAGAQGSANVMLSQSTSRLTLDASGTPNWTLSANDIGGVGTVRVEDGVSARVLTFKGDNTLSPGTSTGTLTVEGSLTLGEVAGTTGILDIQLGGTAAGEFDVLKLLPLSGSPTLTLANAVLNVSFVAPFTPSSGDSFLIVDVSGSNAISGTFAPPINWPSGWTGTVSYTGGTGNDIVLSNLYQLAPPVAEAGGPYTCPYYGSVALSGSVTSGGTPPFTYDWDLDIDGTYDILNDQNPTVSYATLISYGLVPGENAIRLRVTDNNTLSDTDDAQLFLLVPIAEPARLGLIGLALLGLRRRRK